jgi:hypothetical protein
MWGAGGYLQVSRSSNASGVLLGAGGTVLLPLWQREGQLFRAVALAPSLGGYVQKLDGFEPGATASLFFGYRTFNPISSFDMALGVRASFNWGFGASGTTDGSHAADRRVRRLNAAHPAEPALFHDRHGPAVDQRQRGVDAEMRAGGVAFGVKQLQRVHVAFDDPELGRVIVERDGVGLFGV